MSLLKLQRYCQTISSMMNFQDLIAKSIIQIIKESNEFFGLMLFSDKLSKEIPTAATNGKDVFINDFLNLYLHQNKMAFCMKFCIWHYFIPKMGGQILHCNKITVKSSGINLEFIYDKLRASKSFTQYDLIESSSENENANQDDIENYWKDKINLLKNSSLYQKVFRITNSFLCCGARSRLALCPMEIHFKNTIRF